MSTDEKPPMPQEDPPDGMQWVWTREHGWRLHYDSPEAGYRALLARIRKGR